MMKKQFQCRQCRKAFVVGGERTTEGKRTWPVTCPHCDGPNEIEFPSFDGIYDVYPVLPGPTRPYQKGNKKWTFDEFSTGIARRAGEWETQNDAAKASMRMLVIFCKNLCSYAPWQVNLDVE